MRWQIISAAYPQEIQGLGPACKLALLQSTCCQCLFGLVKYSAITASGAAYLLTHLQVDAGAVLWSDRQPFRGMAENPLSISSAGDGHSSAPLFVMSCLWNYLDV